MVLGIIFISPNKKIERVCDHNSVIKSEEQITIDFLNNTLPEDEISTHIVEHIKHFEGFRSETYIDRGQLTIGYGFSKYVMPSLKKEDTITEIEAEQKLVLLLENRYIPYVNSVVYYPLSKAQTEVLAGFTMNIGESQFKKSKVLEHVNKGEIKKASQKLLEWNKSNGKKMPGLVRRRKAEAEMLTNYD